MRTGKVKPQIPDDFEAVTWERLRKGMRAICSFEPVDDSLEALYRCCEDLCHHKMAKTLYENLTREYEQHAENVALQIARITETNDDYLKKFNDIWLEFCRQMLMIRSIFLYLDRTYVIQNCNVQSLWDLGLALFRSTVIMNPILKPKLMNALLSAIHNERAGMKVDLEIIRSCVKMLKSVGSYFTIFEPEFRLKTQDFYMKEATSKWSLFLNGMEIGKEEFLSSYLIHVEDRLKEENLRCSLEHGYADYSTKSEMIKIVQEEMISKYLERILNNGFNEFLFNQKLTDLARLYRLLKGVACYDFDKIFRNHFLNYVKNQVLTRVTNDANDEEKDKTLVSDLISLKIQLNQVLSESFENDDELVKSMKDAFEESMNKRQNKPAELLASFIDQLMKSGKGISVADVETSLDHCLILFRYVQGKDVFEAFYKKFLSKRLLLGKSSNIDVEKTMLSKMKTECGAHFTGHLERMFKDVNLSKDLNKTFQESKWKPAISTMDIYVHVLTLGSWPTFPNEEIILSSQFTKLQTAFQDYYSSKHQHRIMKWQYALGSCLLKAYFEKGDKELDISLYQAIILELFNYDIEYTAAEIMEKTHLSQYEMNRTLQSLAIGKHRILAKNPDSRTIGANDVFMVNDDFASPQYRVKVNSLQSKETVEDNKETEERVFSDRLHQVDAALVRIMKSRKTVTNIALMAELIPILKFQIGAADMKKRIESLIEREYILRDVHDHQLYHYIA